MSNDRILGGIKGLLPTIFGVAGLAIPLHVGAQPKPPTLFCSSSSNGCSTLAADATLTDGKKWHPGHYLKTQGNYADGNQAKYLSSVTSQLSRSTASSEIRGALIQYSWGSLEPRRGQYDWKPIYAHLDWLASRGKRLIVHVETKCFRTKCPVLAPENLRRDVVPTNSGYMVASWRRPVMDQMIAFSRAFAAEFDGHPMIEMVGLLGESCPGFSKSKPKDYSESALARETMRLQDSQAAVFKKTHVFTMINCNPGGQFAAVLENAYRRGLTRGSPDAHDDPGAMLFRGQNGAVRDYRRLMPHMTIMSAPNLGGKDDILPLRNVISQILDLGMTHVAWVSTSSKAPWSSIVDTLEATKLDVVTAMR